jgi:ABC-type glycerol-3-phosphate transport system substrate-binding protein
MKAFMASKLFPSLLIGLSALSLFLAGCTNGDLSLTQAAETQQVQTPSVTPKPRISPTPSPTPLFNLSKSDLEGRQIVVWHPWSGQTGDVLKSLAEEFNQSNEWGITVSLAQQGSSMVLAQNISAQIGSAALPQVVIAPSDDLLLWHRQADLLLPLNDLVTDAQWGFTEQQRADFPLVFWQLDQDDGIQIGIPMQRTTTAIYYNQTWAAELGFRSAPASTEEFQAQACAAAEANNNDASRDNNGTGGWIVDTNGDTIYAWTRAFGLTSPFKGDPLKLSLEQPATRKAFEYLRGLVDQGCAWTSGLTEADEDLFAERRALFFTADLRDLPQVSSAMQRAGSGDEWTILPFPGPDKPTVVVSGLSYGILAGSPENNLAAWIFIRWMNQTDRELKLLEAGGGLPVSTSAIQAADDYRTQYPQWGQAIQWMPYAAATPNSELWASARLVLGDAAWQALQSYLPADQIPAILSQLDDTIYEINAQSGQ